MHPFCRAVTPTSSLLADSRKSVIAVNILTSSMSGLDSSTGIHKQACILSVNKDVFPSTEKSEVTVKPVCVCVFIYYLAVSSPVQMPGCSSQGRSTVSACSPPGPVGR